MSDGVAIGRQQIEALLMPDRFVTSRNTSGPCGVKIDGGDGTPITMKCRIDADILPSDTLVINGRSYMIAESPPTHGLSMARHLKLIETART